MRRAALTATAACRQIRCQQYTIASTPSANPQQLAASLDTLVLADSPCPSASSSLPRPLSGCPTAFAPCPSASPRGALESPLLRGSFSTAGRHGGIPSLLGFTLRASTAGIPACSVPSSRTYGAQAAQAEAAAAGAESAGQEGFARTFLGAWRRDNAAEIGYKVVGPFEGAMRASPKAPQAPKAAEGATKAGEAAEGVEIPTQEMFAVVQIGSHQFKVTAGDAIYVEKLNFTQVNDVVHLEKVLLLGSPCSTLIGRPTLTDAHVKAVVEEHALDAKVIVFKKKRRTTYRRTNGHRQELTRLRILEVVGMEEARREAQVPIA